MSVIKAVRDYLRGYMGLEDGAPVWVNHVGEGDPDHYSIVPITGERIVEEYIDGSSSRAFAFAFQSVETTIDEQSRLEAQEFFESLADWLETQSQNGVFPDMDPGQEPFKMEALGWGTLINMGQSQTGVYQIQCRLEYSQSR